MQNTFSGINIIQNTMVGKGGWAAGEIKKRVKVKKEEFVKRP